MKDQKHVYLEQIQLPDIPTVKPYPMSRIEFWWFKKFRYGIIDDPHSLFFYQIDYFGDMFVLEWNKGRHNKQLKWNQFTVEGDKFEVLHFDFTIKLRTI